MLDFFADLLTKTGAYLALGLAGGFLFLVGNLVFGWRNEGGRRLLLFTFGAGALLIAELLRSYFWPAVTALLFPEALGIFVPVILFPFGGIMVSVALIGSNDWVRFAFGAILRGL
ncbi:MAG: hypothetical protein JNK23_09800 [Opitutaceae bacterium]|nr:hypothetical protein [Opitutaceae bacterium]